MRPARANLKQRELVALGVSYLPHERLDVTTLEAELFGEVEVVPQLEVGPIGCDGTLMAVQTPAAAGRVGERQGRGMARNCVCIGGFFGCTETQK